MPSRASIDSPPTETACPAEAASGSGPESVPQRRPSAAYAENSAGVSLKKIDPACEDLLLWDQGAVAAGARRLGKGLVFHLGSNSSVLPFQILEWLQVKKTPIASSNKAIMTRHFVSNNGLYDFWILWNTRGETVHSTFTFREGFRPRSLQDVNTGKVVALDSDANGFKLANVAFGAWETRAFLSPRGQIDQAPAEWFRLQRDWWRGTADPGPPIPPFESKVCLNLTEDWAYKILDGGAVGDPEEDLVQADPKLDDSSWKRRRIGIQPAGQTRCPLCHLSQDVPGPGEVESRSRLSLHARRCAGQVAPVPGRETASAQGCGR